MSKKRNIRKKRSKPKSLGNEGRRALAQAKVLLIKSSKPSSSLSSLRKILGPANYAPFLSWLREQPNLIARTIAAPFPQRLQELRPFSSPKHLSLANEFRWCYYHLEPHLHRLASFNRLREELDDAFIEGNGACCLELLTTIEETYGISIWLLKKKVAFLQQFEGLEQQKAFVETIKEQSESLSAIIPYIIHFVSYRSEPSVSPITFRADYETRLRNPGLREIRAYLRQHILSLPPDTMDELATILSIETSGTAIDGYEMLVAAAQLAVANEQQALCPFLLPILKRFATGINDIRLSRLLFLLGENGSEDVILPPMGLEGMISLFSDHEKLPPPFFVLQPDSDIASASSLINSLLFALSDCNNKDSEAPVSPEIFSAMKSVLSGSEDQSTSAAILSRVAWAIEGSCAAHLIRIILDWSENACLDPIGQPVWFRHIAGLGRLFPFELYWIVNSSLRTLYIDIFSRQGVMPQPWLIFEDDTAPFSITKHDAHANPFGLWRGVNKFLRARDWSSALTAAIELLRQESSFLKRQAVRAIPFCLLNLGKTHECVCFLAEQAIADRSINPILPIKEIFDSLSDAEKASMDRLLAFAVFIDLYVSRSVIDVAYLRSFAAEDFLSANSLLRPSELRHHTGSYDHALLTHFLRHICVESVMDTWVAFGGSQEVANERALVCQLLAELNPDSKDEFQAEIRDIMRRLTLSKRLREVEQSKIYVDTSSVKTVARQTLIESFNRYIAFVRTGMTPEEKSVLRNTRQRIAQGDVEVLLSGAFPRNEMTELFEFIVARLRDEFVSSSQHGLDGYLSVRVRHGTLAGQLRGPLEAEGLVTLRDSKSGKYKINTFWPEILQLTRGSQHDFLQMALSDFTDSFDALVEEMKSSWLQIKKTPDGIGLIDFSLLRPEVDYLSTGIRDDMTFDVFLEYIFSYFLSEKLEPSLKRIRQELKNIAKSSVNEMLLKLQSTVEDALGTDTTWKLRSAIGRARTQIQNVLDRITEWFRLSKAEMLREPFSIEEAVNIVTASIQASCPDFRSNLKISEEILNLRIAGSLPSFVDLLFLVFENAVRHSQMAPHPLVDVTVSLSDDILHIHAVNSLGAGVPEPGAMESVEVIRMDLQSNVFSQSVMTEGGTGFYKMQKILHHDFCLSSRNHKPTLDFGLSEGSRFFVHMTIPVIISEQKETEE